MDFEKLYRLGVTHKRTALHVRPRDPDEIEDELALYEGRLRPQRCLEFEFMKGASGSTANDFVSTSLPPLKLISDRVMGVLRGFSGWATYPVKVYGKNGEVIPGYHGLAVVGRCGPIDDSRSRPAIRPPAVPHGRPTQMWIGLYFDPTTWEDTDVFLPEGSGQTFVTDAVKATFERARITNVHFVQLTEAENMSSALLFGKARRR